MFEIDRGCALPEFLSGELIARFLGVLWLDLILSGDNAVVIALAVRRLEGPTRRRAIFLGVFGAVALRLLFAAVVSYLLAVPLLLAAGGLLLLWIAWRLVQGDEHEEGEKVQAGSNLGEAIRIIIMADAVMSLDNVVALVGVSGGNLWLLVIGLALTIPLVIFGSAIFSALFGRFPWLVYIGAGALVWVSAEMILGDPIIADLLGESLHGTELIVQALATILFVGIAWLWSRRAADSAAK